MTERSTFRGVDFYPSSVRHHRHQHNTHKFSSLGKRHHGRRDDDRCCGVVEETTRTRGRLFLYCSSFNHKKQTHDNNKKEQSHQCTHVMPQYTKQICNQTQCKQARQQQQRQQSQPFDDKPDTARFLFSFLVASSPR